MTAPMAMHDTRSAPARLAVLDGWRAVSILLVLAAHLLPLGPKAWRLNETAGTMGMALFFILSGFLITTFLLDRPDPRAFLIRRMFRILPLAWITMAFALALRHAPAGHWAAHGLFYANLPPFWLYDVTGPLWSLCVEIHFYLAVALLVALRGPGGLALLPWAGLAVTALRVATGTPLSIVTHLRVDEILAGAALALAHRAGDPAEAARARWHAWLRPATSVWPWLAVVGLAASAHPALPWLNYARPYLAALCVGATLVHRHARAAAMLRHRGLAYIAAISFALYLLHPLLVHSWLGSGATLERYAKRPALLAALWLLAHLSTFHLERRCIALGKRLSARPPRPATAARMET